MNLLDALQHLRMTPDIEGILYYIIIIIIMIWYQIIVPDHVL